MIARVESITSEMIDMVFLFYTTTLWRAAEPKSGQCPQFESTFL
jgi:hypothetical protein